MTTATPIPGPYIAFKAGHPTIEERSVYVVHSETADCTVAIIGTGHPEYAEQEKVTARLLAASFEMRNALTIVGQYMADCFADNFANRAAKEAAMTRVANVVGFAIDKADNGKVG